VCSANPKCSATSSQGIRGYVSVKATLKVAYSSIKGIMFLRIIMIFSNWRCVYFIWPLEYLIKKPPAPTKRAIIGLSKAKSFNVFSSMLLLCIRSYLKPILRYKFLMPVIRTSIPVTARSKGWVSGRLIPGTAGSNPAGGMNVSCEYCVLSGRSLCVVLVTRPGDS
jgi:hypothetical protein